MKTMSVITFLALCCGLAFSAIAQDSAGQIASPEYFHRTFIGKIAGKYPIEMDVRRSGNNLKGSYKYTGKKNSLILYGTIDSSGRFKMQEWADFKQTGVWSGKLSGDTLAGEWSTPDGSKKMAVEAYKTAEFKLKPKKELLRSAIGTYTLQSIEGARGANGMFDITRKDGAWHASSSGISEGMRVGQENNLSGGEIKLLNSTRITVDEKLSTRFFAGEKLLLEIPLNENGMKYSMSRPHSSVLDDKLKNFSPSSVYVDVDGKIYLAAMDGIDYSGTLTLEDMVTQGILVLRYSPEAKTFEMDISIESCCDSNTLTFTRQ